MWTGSLQSHLSWSVLKRVRRSCFTAWSSASLPSVESASEYAAPFAPAFWLGEAGTLGFSPSTARGLLTGSSAACFRAAALVLAKPAAFSLSMHTLLQRCCVSLSPDDRQ